MATKKKTVKKKASRRNIPPKTKWAVLAESGHKCGNPTCRNILTQLHHIVWIKDGGGNEPENLLPLCGHCHDLHTQGHIPKESIRHWKGLLQAMNSSLGIESMDLLLFLHNTQRQSNMIRYSGDGVLRFASLIASGYVHITASIGGGGMIVPGGSNTSSHGISLTEKGKMLVESWLKGDERLYREHLEM